MMPSPKQGESKKDYLNRCMADPEMNSKHPAQDERYAVCNSFWNNRGKNMAKTYSITAEVFAVGKWNGMEFNREDLQSIAAAFHTLADNHQVPLKMGHNDTQPFTDGQPALGWVTDLSVNGDKLLATFSDVPEVVYQAIKTKLYRNVSIELDFGVDYKGQYFPSVLSGVALLGADIPAVNTLADLQAYMGRDHDDDLKSKERMVFTAIQTETQMRKTDMPENNQEIAELRATSKAQEATIAKQAEEIVQLKRQLDEQKAEFKVLRAAEDQRKLGEQKTELFNKLEGMVKAKKITPATRDEYMRDFDDATDKETVVYAVKRLDETIDANPAYFGAEQARAKAKKAEEEDGQSASQVVLNRTNEYMASHDGIDFSTAKRKVLEADRDLANRYAKGGD